MARFATMTFRRSPSSTEAVEPVVDLSQRVRLALPPHFEAVGDALVADADVAAACSVVGRRAARDGAALGEALSALHETYRLVRGAPPSFEATEALSVAWSEATLEYLHDLSCEDPLTGLASLAHVRTRLAEIYREAELSDVPVPSSHALVVVELRPRGPVGRPGEAGEQFHRSLRLVQVSEAMRAVYSGGQTLGRLRLDRAAAVVPRSADLGVSVGLLREFLRDLDLGEAAVRVWIEGLPASPDSGARLLDELAR